jgi:hypothetical protein
VSFKFGGMEKHTVFLFVLFVCSVCFCRLKKKKNYYFTIKHELLYNYGLHFTSLFNILNTSYQ